MITGRTTNQSHSNSELVLYNPVYSDVFCREAFAFGFISLILTIINIICIIITGWAILKLKEVAPEKIPQHLSSFWKKDLKVHRDYLNTIKDGKTLIDEARHVLGTGKSTEHALEDTFIQTMFEKAHVDEDMINIREWIAKPAPGIPKVKKFSSGSMHFGSFDADDLSDRTQYQKKSTDRNNADVESTIPHLRIRAFSENNGEILRQRLHAQAQIIIASRRVSSLDANRNRTESNLI